MSQLQVTGEAKIRDIQGPVVANSGVITALDGAASQYVRGDGTLADFPSSSGGGSSVSYYLNSSVSQGTIDGNAYRELSKDPIIGSGTDIAISSNGYVANYITDANDPDVVIVPGGNFNCEFYFSVNNNTGSPTTYAELYKYDGSTFTLLGSSSGVPESINQGTTIAPYYFAIPVATATLATTDRLAIRIYVNVDGRTVTLHTENSHLCQVVTTLSKGMVSLNNLTDQSQYLTTGTSGTNFNIASSGDTHTFNLPVASATNTGKLSSTDWSTFNGKVPYTGANNDVDLGLYNLNAQHLFANGLSGINSGNLLIYQGPDFALSSGYTTIYSNGNNIGFVSNPSGSTTYNALFDLSSLSATRTFTLPNLSGTIALLEGAQTFSGAKTFSATTLLNTIYVDGVSYLKHQTTTSYIAGYTTFNAKANGVIEYFFPSSFKSILDFNDAADYTYTFPASSGTLALTSDLSSYVPYTGASGNVDLGANNLVAKHLIVNGVSGSYGGSLLMKQNANAGLSNNYTSISSSGLNFVATAVDGAGVLYEATFNLASITTNRSYTLPNASGTIALTSDLGSYVTLATTQTISGFKTFTALATNNEAVGIKLTSGVVSTGGYLTLNAKVVGTLHSLFLAPDSSTNRAEITFDNTALRTYALPNNSGTIALTSNLSGYLPLTGGTLTGALNGTSATFSGNVGIGKASSSFALDTLLTDSSTNTIVGVAQIGRATSGTAANGIGGNIQLTAEDTAGNQRTAAYIGWSLTNASSAAPEGYMYIGARNSADALKISDSGAATFSSSVTAGSEFISYSGITMDAGGGLIRGGLTINYVTGEFKSFCGVAGNTYFQTFNTNGSERMRITSAGNVGIGTSSPTAKLSINADWVAGGATVRCYPLTSFASGGVAGYGMFDSDGTTRKGYINASTNYMEVWCQANSPMTFGTNDIERMRITSGGNVCIGATSYTSLPTAQVFAVFGSGSQGTLKLGGYGAPHTQVTFIMDGVTTAGTISCPTSSTTNYNTSSDYRLKQDFKDFNGLDLVSLIKTYNYEWKSDNKRSYGVIAHELQEIFPQAVTGEKDGKQMQGVDYSKIVPILVKAIQEQQAQIEELKALIAAK